MRRKLQHVLDQSLKGHHHLFSPGVVRFALAHGLEDGAWEDPGTARATECLLDDLESERDVWQQRDRIASAPLPVQEVLVHLYFDVLYRYMERRDPTLH